MSCLTCSWLPLLTVVPHVVLSGLLHSPGHPPVLRQAVVVGRLAAQPQAHAGHERGVGGRRDRDCEAEDEEDCPKKKGHFSLVQL